jgi:beta-lactamase regulating signal transducer with metallopeptidase domain/uncharacterized GH25 family protein
MDWQIPIGNFLARALLSGLAISLVGVVVASAFRQPARKLRVLELTILACLVAPVIPLLPGLPRWSILPEAAIRPIPSLPSEPAPAIPEATIDGLAQRPPIGAPGPSQPQRPTPPPFSWDQVFIAIYLGIACCFTLRWILGIVALTRLIRASRPAGDSLREQLVEVAGPGAKRLRLRLSDRIKQPVAASVFRPTILLPEELIADGDPVTIRCAIAHEWSHIERRDLLTWYLASLALIPFFALPTFWWLRRKVRLCQDYLADARAARFAPTPEDYADFLIRFAGRLQPRTIGLGLGDRGISLRRRIEMLITPHEPLQQRCPRRQTVAIVLAASGLILAVGSIRLEAADPPSAPATRPAVEVSFTGTVVDSGTNQPLADAEVVVRFVEPGQLSGGDPVASAKTDAEGRYRVTVPGIGRDESFRTLLVTADHPKYASSTLRSAPVFILKNQPAPNLPTFAEIKLKPAKPTTGLIVTPEGRPAPGVVVIASWSVIPPRDQLSLSNPPQTGRLVTKTDEQGRFEVKTPTDANVRFEFIPSGFVGSSLGLETTRRGELDKISLKAGLRLKGVVLDSEGRPLAGVGLWIGGQGPETVRQTETDAEGKFAFEPLPAGACTLLPTPSLIDQITFALVRSRPLPAAFSPSAIKLVLKDGEEPAPITIKAVPHVSVEVLCLDGSGKPVADQSVMVLSPIPALKVFAGPAVPRPESWASAGPSGPDGRVTILVPRGAEGALIAVDQRVVRYEDAEGRPIPKSMDGVVLKNLEKDIKGVVVRVFHSPVVSLKLATRDGAAPKDLKVEARYDGERPSPRWIRILPGLNGIDVGETDRMRVRQLGNGRLQFSSIVPGLPITITASAEGFRPADVKATLSEGESKDLELVLERQ